MTSFLNEDFNLKTNNCENNTKSGTEGKLNVNQFKFRNKTSILRIEEITEALNDKV